MRWGGYRLRDVFDQFMQPHLLSDKSITLAVFRGMDKAKGSLLLEDALADSVLLADTLNGEPLTSKHGAPLRLIAPAHYGYKSVKHLSRIEFWQDASNYKPGIPKIMEHPRARVAFEERGRYLPGWFYRYLYRPLINSAVRQMNTRYASE